MIDIIGAMTLTTLFAACCAALVTAMPVSPAARWRIAAVGVGWFGLMGALSAFGVFAVGGLGTVAIGAALLMPLVALLITARRSVAVRHLALTMPLTVLVAVHAGRLLGYFFVKLFDAGRLPPTFALTAGWGDVVVAAMAVPLAWAIHRQVTGWRPATFVWNGFGLLDLVAAVTLGVGSAPDSPVRFIFETPSSGAVATLPWAMIPTVLVPLYLLTHLAIFAQLRRAQSAVVPSYAMG